MVWEGQAVWYPEPKEAFSLIESSELSHPSGALLKSFILDALDPLSAAEFVLARCGADRGNNVQAHLLSLVDDWTYIVESLSKYGSPPRAPDPVERQAIIRRDGSRCCITGSPGHLWDPLVIEPILPVPSRWTAEPGRDAIFDMLGAFFSPPYRDWWLSHSREPQHCSPYSTHWLVTKSAARAFARGVIKLDRLQPSTVEFSVLQLPIGPEDPLRLYRSNSLLIDHSQAEIPEVNPYFVGTHARFSKSMQLIELSDKLSLHGTSPSVPPASDNSRTKQRLVAATTKLLSGMSSLMQPLSNAGLACWLVIPAQVRILAYRTLRRAAKRFIDPESESVQRLPFGLYLKHTFDTDSLRNEVNALHMVRRYTSIPVPKPLDFVTAPVDGRYVDEEGYLLMTRIPGVPLSRCNQVLSDNDAARVTAQLQAHITQLRAIPKATSTNGNAICDSLGGECRDSRIRMGRPVGPFADEAAFNKVLRNSDDPARTGHRIFFSHADLNPRNILVEQAVQQDGSLGWRVTGIVDWEMAGYYPEYWEYTKSLYERFRWTRRYQHMIHRLFRVFGDYEKEYDVELRSWEAGI